MKYSEILLALFIFVGRIKGDPRLTEIIPFDLTVLFALSVYIVILYRIKQYNWSLIPIYLWLYLPFICLMILSIYYSPLPDAGLEKALKFIFLSGLSIISPFFVLDTPTKLRNFFITLLFLNFAVSLEPLSHMGDPITDDSDGRLKVVGGNTAELGSSGVMGVATILFIVLPQLNKTAIPIWYFLKKIFLYLMTIIFFLAVIGAGARSATISLVMIVILNTYFYKHLRSELLIMVCLGASSLLFVNIPEHAVTYLATLINSDTGSLLNWRGHLMSIGLGLIVENPIFGIGLGGFPYFGTVPPPDPWLFYNWPHNVLIEIGCEMGLIATLIACVLIILPFIETFRQLTNKNFCFKIYSRMAFACLVIGFITLMNTGDINNQRNMWLYMSLPFVIRKFKKT